jgi:pimeloyl-ACP methyl ester carboxylesterase
MEHIDRSVFGAALPVLAHRIDGDGPPLLLLNGGLMSIAAWDPFVAALAMRLRVVRSDFRGQLLSPGEPNASMEQHADDLMELLDHLGVERVHVAGASFGGEVGMILAALHPSRVSSLSVITATDRITGAMREDARGLHDAAKAAAAGGRGARVFELLAPKAFSSRWLAAQPPEFIATRAKQIGALPASFFAGVAGLMSALLTLDLEALLPRITAPTLVVAAELDETFPPEHSRAIAAAIPGARLEIVEGSGHAAIVEAPDRVIQLVLGHALANS